LLPEPTTAPSSFDPPALQKRSQPDATDTPLISDNTLAEMEAKKARLNRDGVKGSWNQGTAQTSTPQTTAADPATKATDDAPHEHRMQHRSALPMDNAQPDGATATTTRQVHLEAALQRERERALRGIGNPQHRLTRHLTKHLSSGEKRDDLSASAKDDEPSDHVVLRKLLPCWSTALAEGRQFTEFQRYRDTDLNQLKHVGPRSLFVVGRTGTPQLVDAVAVVQEEPTRHQTAAHVPSVLNFASKELQDDLKEYLTGFRFFEYVHFDTVFDLRSKDLSVDDFLNIFDVPKPAQAAGYPRLQRSRPNLREDILTWCKVQSCPMRRRADFLATQTLHPSTSTPATTTSRSHSSTPGPTAASSSSSSSPTAAAPTGSSPTPPAPAASLSETHSSAADAAELLGYPEILPAMDDASQRGLKNLGNTCYGNALLFVLAKVHAFRAWLQCHKDFSVTDHNRVTCPLCLLHHDVSILAEPAQMRLTHR